MAIGAWFNWKTSYLNKIVRKNTEIMFHSFPQPHNPVVVIIDKIPLSLCNSIVSYYIFLEIYIDKNKEDQYHIDKTRNLWTKQDKEQKRGGTQTRNVIN